MFQQPFIYGVWKQANVLQNDHSQTHFHGKKTRTETHRERPWGDFGRTHYDEHITNTLRTHH